MHADCALKRGARLSRVLAQVGIAGLALVTVSGCVVTDQAASGADATAAAVAGPPDHASKTAVPPPGGPGDLSPIKVKPQPTLPPADLGDVVEITSGLTAEVSLARATVKASRPGEIAGSAAEVTVTLTNTGTEPRDASTVLVTVEDADKIPLSPSYSDPYLPLQEMLAAGDNGQGVYVFTLDDPVAEPLTVYVSPAADEPVAAIVGGLE